MLKKNSFSIKKKHDSDPVPLVRNPKAQHWLSIIIKYNKLISKSSAHVHMRITL